MIANSGHDENGKYHGGKAGDQTGSEWEIRSWYNRPWNKIIRHPDEKVRDLIASYAEHAAANNHIGYDQDNRTSFWKELKKAGYDPKNITVDCEADCSSGIAAIVKAAGYTLGIDKLKDVPSDTYTGDEAANLKKAGFSILTAEKYTASEDYLLRGDILLYEGHHTAINLTTGTKAETKVSHTTVKYGVKGDEVKKLQAIFNGLGYKDWENKSLEEDGSCGSRTVYVIKSFQDDYDLDVDGSCGPKTWAKIDEITKASSSYRVKVTTALNLRKGPGTSYGIKKVLSTGSVYTVTRNNGAWLYLSEPDGWVKEDYVKKV